MVLDNQRDNVDPLLNRFAKLFIHFNPNVLSLISLIFAFLAGVFFYFSNPVLELSNFYLYFAALFVFLNGFFDAIDGKVAKLTGKDSAKGDFIDHAFDRFSDVLMLGGLALSPWCIDQYAIGLIAVAGMLLTSYMGTQSQAVGAKRNYSGLLGRADRLVLLMIAPILQHILLFVYGFDLLFGFSLLTWVLVYFAVVGVITAVQRFFSTLAWFNKK
jgi:archaetidylinositol phosphate synthase